MKSTFSSFFAVAIVGLLISEPSKSLAERPLLVTYYYYSPSSGLCTSITISPVNCSPKDGGVPCTYFVAAEGTAVILYQSFSGSPCGVQLKRNN